MFVYYQGFSIFHTHLHSDICVASKASCLIKNQSSSTKYATDTTLLSILGRFILFIPILVSYPFTIKSMICLLVCHVLGETDWLPLISGMLYLDVNCQLYLINLSILRCPIG